MKNFPNESLCQENIKYILSENLRKYGSKLRTSKLRPRYTGSYMKKSVLHFRPGSIAAKFYLDCGNYLMTRRSFWFPAENCWLLILYIVDVESSTTEDPITTDDLGYDVSTEPTESEDDSEPGDGSGFEIESGSGVEPTQTTEVSEDSGSEPNKGRGDFKE